MPKMQLKKPMKYASAIASLVLAASSHAATTITTDGFNIGSIVETDWTNGGTVTGGQWSLTSSGGQSRVVVGNPYGYGGQATPQEGTGQAQFSNGWAGESFTATLTDTVGHYFTAGDQVAINFFSAARTGDSGPLGITVSLVGADTLSYGAFTPASTSWGENTTSYFTIVNTGTYNVQFANVAQGGDRTTYLDSVSYKVEAIPEPTAALLGGLGMLCLLRRRRQF
jgi:hypothetical protein